MTNVLNLASESDSSLLLLLRDCSHARQLLLRQIEQDYETLFRDILPLFTAASSVLRQAAQANWSQPHLDHALKQLAALEFMCARITRLMRCYQDVSMPTESGLQADADRSQTTAILPKD